MLAKKGMSKKKTIILIAALVVMVIVSLIIAYNTFWKKSKFTPMPIDGNFYEGISDSSTEYPSEEFMGYPQAPVETPADNAPLTRPASEFKLELFELQDFKNLKSYIDLPIKIDPQKVGNPDPFFVPVEVEEEQEQDNEEE